MKSKYSNLIIVILLTIFLNGVISENSKDDVNDYIIGGCNTKSTATVPYQVSVQELISNGRYISKFCGGTIIHKKWVLAAAHCFKSGAHDLKNIYVRAGSIDPFNPTETTQFVPVKNVIVHKDFTGDRLSYVDKQYIYADIALLELKVPLTLNQYVKRAKIPGQYRQLRPQTEGIISGWGIADMTDPDACSNLKHLKVKIIDNEVCKKRIFRTMPTDGICVGGPNKTACGGDSGGPFVINNKNTYVVYGVCSYGEIKCQESTVYIDVSYHTNWILKNTKKDIDENFDVHY